MINENGYKCGFVALTGLPNAGKSTLINALLKEHVALTSAKPQATRNAIQGIKTTEESQIIFVDTPGYHVGKGKLSKAMVQQTEEAIFSVHAVCVLADPKEKGGSEFKSLLDKVEQSGVPAFLVLTKLDDRSKEELYKAAERLSTLYPFDAVIPVSAKTGANLDKLEAMLMEKLPDHPPVYPPDEITTQPEHFLVAEYIREQAFALLHEEVPYDILVHVESIEENNGRMDIFAEIIVSRESQKGIVIGKGASKIKQIGINARKAIEDFFEIKVRLELNVKVKDAWSSKDEYLKIQGL